MILTNPGNVFKDWTVVHVPYCTGDLQFGNAVLEPMNSPLVALFDQSQCLKQNMSTHLNGYENSVAALKWAVANYPNPEHLALGGTSAGSLAAQAFSEYVVTSGRSRRPRPLASRSWPTATWVSSQKPIDSLAP